MNCLRIVKRIWNAIPLSDYNRWRVTAWIIDLAIPFVRGGVIHHAFLREKEWQEKRIRPFYGDGLPILPKQEAADIFIFGVIDWRLRIQRPQHLARGLAQSGRRVFYLSTAFVHDRSQGFELEDVGDNACLYVVRLHLPGRPLVYAAPPAAKDLQRLKRDLAEILRWTNSRQIVSVVEHPYWYELAGSLPGSQLIYDCMDRHDGFVHTGTRITSIEQALLGNAEAIIATSQSLYDTARHSNPNTVLIRNAADFDFFSVRPDSVFRDVQERPILGYYGAIADWIDIELLKCVAHRFGDCLLLMIGSDECGARQQLAAFPNVLFTGEVNYANLPHFLYGMDVCLLPFRVNALTLATNPVKVYEYLAAGKTVVAMDLPELSHFECHVETATTHLEFLERIDAALAVPESSPAEEERRRFSAQNTWHHRVQAFQEVIDSLSSPLVSIIIVTYNNLALTQACLDSIDRFTDYPNVETIIVDNASIDGTQLFLSAWASSKPEKRRVILNDSNRGFSAANNQGLSVASGEYFVLLNNDTEVTPTWLRTLLNHMRQNPALGLLGPVTDNIGNEAQIALRYSSANEMRERAKNYTLSHMGETFQIRTLAFFCVMLRKSVFEEVGPLDEDFGLGFFEDDDYCRRVELAGWQIRCAEDVFVRHHLSASFNKLGARRRELLEENRKRYEMKWGHWIPHKRR